MSTRKFPSLRFSEENERLKEDFLFASRAACFGNQPQRHVPTWNLQLLDESGLGAWEGSDWGSSRGRVSILIELDDPFFVRLTWFLECGMIDINRLSWHDFVTNRSLKTDPSSALITREQQPKACEEMPGTFIRRESMVQCSCFVPEMALVQGPAPLGKAAR